MPVSSPVHRPVVRPRVRRRNTGFRRLLLSPSLELLLRLLVHPRSLVVLLALVSIAYYFSRPGENELSRAPVQFALWAESADSPNSSKTADQPDPLWQRAVAVAGRNANWVPRRIVEQQQVLSQSGDLHEASRTVLLLQGERQSRLRTVVQSSTKNGVDQRAAKQAEIDAEQAAKAGKGDAGSPDWDNGPFAPENQAQVSYRALGPKHDLTENGRKLRAFAFTQRSDEGVWDGKTWLDAKSGMPVKLESTARVSTLPPDPQAKEHEFELKSLHLSARYLADSPQSWRATSMRMHMKIRVKIAPLVYFEGRVVNRYEFSQYARVRP